MRWPPSELLLSLTDSSRSVQLRPGGRARRHPANSWIARRLPARHLIPHLILRYPRLVQLIQLLEHHTRLQVPVLVLLVTPHPRRDRAELAGLGAEAGVLGPAGTRAGEPPAAKADADDLWNRIMSEWREAECGGVRRRAGGCGWAREGTAESACGVERYDGGCWLRWVGAYLLDDFLQLLLPVDSIQSLIPFKLYRCPDCSQLAFQLVQPVGDRISSLALRASGPVSLAENCITTQKCQTRRTSSVLTRLAGW